MNSTATNITLPKVALGSTLSLIGESQVWIAPSNLNSTSEYNEYNEMFYQNGTTWVYPVSKFSESLVPYSAVIHEPYS